MSDTALVKRKRFSASPPRILSIAGSDPSGGAGIQADLKTIASLGCYGMSVITSLTAQNTCGVTSIHVPPPQFLASQLEALWNDIEIDAIKIGMLANQDVVRLVAQQLQSSATRQIPVVLDPVMVSTSGSLLLTEESIDDLITHLLPQCTLLTPNLPEAQQLLARSRSASSAPSDIHSLHGLLQAAQELCALGPQATLVKGGHGNMSSAQVERDLSHLGVLLQEENHEAETFLGAEVLHGHWQGAAVTVVRSDGQPYADVLRRLGGQAEEKGEVVLDALYERAENRFTLFVKSKVDSTATHGTGCTLSSALAVYLATCSSSTCSVHSAIQYVQMGISRGLTDLGQGNGPLNHLCVTTPRAVLDPAAGRGAGRAPLCSRLITHSLPYWRAFTRHAFVEKLIDSSLPSEAFIYFLRQDYLFLQHYARVWASGASSFTVGSSFERIRLFAGIAAEMAAEADNHVKVCEPWGITKHQLEHETVESAATLAYTRFVLDVSRAGDALELLAATGPCLLGYGEVGLRIAESQQKDSRDKSTDARAKGFQDWIDYYAGDAFQTVVRQGIENMEAYSQTDPPSPARMASLQRIWDA